MRRVIPYLRGLAIIAVVASHCAGTGLGALFFWTRHNLGGDPPYLGQYGSLTYVGLIAVAQLALFAVPAFLFISGYFAAYWSRDGTSGQGWKVVRTRILSLLWPYLVWSLVAYLALLFRQYVLGWQATYSFDEFVVRLFSGSVLEAYFFIPLLVQFYLLAQLVTRLAKERPILLVGCALAIQLLFSLLSYAGNFGVSLPGILRNAAGMDAVIFLRNPLFFCLGVVFGFHSSQVGRWLARHRQLLVAITIVLGALSVLETFGWHYVRVDVLGKSQETWLMGFPWKFSTLAYSIVAILTVLSLDRKKLWLSQSVEKFGNQSYGIYLIHPIILLSAATLLYIVVPEIASYQWALQPVLFLTGLGIPVLIIGIVSRVPNRILFRMLFG